MSQEDGVENMLFCRKPCPKAVLDWRLAGMFTEIFDLRETIRHRDFKFTSIQLTQSFPVFIE